MKNTNVDVRQSILWTNRHSHETGAQTGVWGHDLNVKSRGNIGGNKETQGDSQMAAFTTTASESLELRLYPAALTAFTLNT